MIDDAPMTNEPADDSEFAPGVRRLRAPNPSPMTGPGTNSYVIGHGPYAIVDPAVDDAGHLARLRAAAGNDVAAIVLTHRHADHAAGAEELATATGAPIIAWPKPVAGAHDVAIVADEPLVDRSRLHYGGIDLVVHHVPGHAADCVALELPASRLLLAGDTLMDTVTVVILPPDGDMTAYLDSLERLATLDLAAIAPGHGELMTAPADEIAQVLAHRRAREAEVVAALAPDASRGPGAIAAALYPALDSRLRPMAEKQIEAHLIRLAELGLAVRDVDRGWRAAQS